MRRTGLVWRPFNLIYGFGAVLLTLCLYRLRRKNDRWIFLGGALLGGGYEYLCSWLRETLLGTVSWDYSEIPFNLNGRVNLLYCFFGGSWPWYGSRGCTRCAPTGSSGMFPPNGGAGHLSAGVVYAGQHRGKRGGGIPDVTAV
ncbi:MAG: putative ABC transporter permease [Oscillospiraceae bacterium]|nr:putative ABC transporter permease [Oscillospiraceae bacterium]